MERFFPTAPNQFWHLQALERELMIWQQLTQVQVGAFIHSGKVPCVSPSPWKVNAPNWLFESCYFPSGKML